MEAFNENAEVDELTEIKEAVDEMNTTLDSHTA